MPTAARRSPGVQLCLLGGDLIGVTFPYQAQTVQHIKTLEHRRWNAGEARWEVHVACLEGLREIFGLKDDEIPEAVAARHRECMANRIARVRLGTLEGQLEGGGLPVRTIDEATSFFLPGHKFSPKFKAGRWDGKRHLFNTRSMKFPAGLWPRVQRVLTRHGIKYEYIQTGEAEAGDEKKTLTFGPVVSELRDYQTQALEKAVERRRGILQLATGAGKTLLAAHLIRRLAMPTIFFVHTRELLYQTAKVFERELGVEIGLLGDGQADMRDVTIATLQTAARVLGIASPRSADPDTDEKRPRERTKRLSEDRKRALGEAIAGARVVIFDECHHVPAETAYKIALKTSLAGRRYGLSATPWRDDGHDLLLEAALGARIVSVSCSDLIGRNYLVRPRIVMQKADGPRRPGRGWTYPEIYRAFIVENPRRNRAIATQARQWAESGRSVLILVGHVAHGERLLELLPEARFAHGQVETALRREWLEDLERKLRPILVATTLADEGLDLPSLDGVILAGGGKSPTKAYQRIGRALRPAPGKAGAEVLDFFDPAPYLEEHSLARLALYRHEPAFDVETRGFQA